jgi:aarF domain-containing kinase
LQLANGKLGLIDYGQTRAMDDETRLAFARIFVALHAHPDQVAPAMRAAGFALRDESDEMLRQYATVLFDHDIESQKRGYKIAQEYFAHLMKENPIVSMPDAAIFIARTSLMFRGMGSALGENQIQTAKYWYKHAQKALDDASELDEEAMYLPFQWH